jgi:glycosyltransferase involved in cell wall biosynthesis
MWSELSVVLCAHNAEKTIQRTLQSIEPLIELGTKLIIVDDDSSDQTPTLIQEFIKLFNNIESVSISRMGSAGARNTGLSLVKSKFVMFCDSDDEITLPSSNFDDLILKDSDFIVFDYEWIQKDQVSILKKLNEICKANDKQRLSLECKTLLLQEMGFWRYIYRTSFLIENKIRFVGELNEINADFFVLDDYFFILKVLTCAEIFTYVPNVLYKYYANPSASFERFRRQSRFMGRAANIQMRDEFIGLDVDSTKWYGSKISEQLTSSFKVISLIDSFREIPSFVRAIWMSNRRFKRISIINSSIDVSRLLIILVKKIISKATKFSNLRSLIRDLKYRK